MEMKEIREWKEGGNVRELRNYGMDGWMDWLEGKKKGGKYDERNEEMMYEGLVGWMEGRK